MLEFLADRVEGNLLAAQQEVQKLALLLPPGELDLETVREAVANVARYDADAPREAMLAGDLARYARVLEGLRGEGEAPDLLLWIAEDERAVRAARRLAAGKPASAVPRAASGSTRRCSARCRPPGAAARARRSTRRWRSAAQIDRMVKGVGQGRRLG